MYAIGDKIVYPMHGAGYIENIETKEIAGKNAEYYTIHIINGNITLCLPVDNKADIQLRPISSKAQATQILSDFEQQEIDLNISWTKRYQKNLERMKAGDLASIAEVVKELMTRDLTNGLSTGDRKMLILSRNIFVTELSVILEKDSQKLLDHLSEIIRSKLNNAQ